jgi:hypothetical protein
MVQVENKSFETLSSDMVLYRSGISGISTSKLQNDYIRNQLQLCGVQSVE